MYIAIYKVTANLTETLATCESTSIFIFTFTVEPALGPQRLFATMTGSFHLLSSAPPHVYPTPILNDQSR